MAEQPEASKSLYSSAVVGGAVYQRMIYEVSGLSADGHPLPGVTRGVLRQISQEQPAPVVYVGWPICAFLIEGDEHAWSVARAQKVRGAVPEEAWWKNLGEEAAAFLRAARVEKEG